MKRLVVIALLALAGCVTVGQVDVNQCKDKPIKEGIGERLKRCPPAEPDQPQGERDPK